MANSYDVKALPDYVEQHREELIAKSVMGAKSAYLMTLQTGVKGPVALNLIDTEVVFGDGSTCGWNEAGKTTLSQRILTPAAIKVNMAVCDKNLLAKWANYLVRVEAGKTDRDLPFEKEFVDGVIKGVKAELEEMIWQGVKGTGKFDGLLTIINTASGVKKVSTAASKTAYEFLKDVYASLPEVKEDTVIFVGEDLYRSFMQDLVSANLYHYDPNNGEDEYRLPGSTVRVIGVPGLNGTNKAVATRLSNLFYGTNLEDGEELFDLWYSKDNREFRLAIEFIAGVQVAYPEDVVLGTKLTA